MKVKSILIATCLSICSAVTINASSQLDVQSNASNWTAMFVTKIGNILHTPDKVQLAQLTALDTLNINSPLVNNVPLAAPLVLKVNLSPEEFVVALKRSNILLLDIAASSWNAIFETKIGNILHEPNRIKMGALMVANELIVGGNINGVALTTPLALKVESSPEDFIAALKRSEIF